MHVVGILGSPLMRSRSGRLLRLALTRLEIMVQQVSTSVVCVLLDSVCAVASQLTPHEAGGYVPDADLVPRLERALQALLERITPAEPAMRCSA